MTKQFELVVDRIKCDGRGLCAEILPERVRLDSWGYPIIAPGPIPDHLMGLAQRAVDDCPVLALALRRAEVQAGRAQGAPKARRAR
jgi:ferredoxin